jgi:putative flippase GtrA
MISFSSLLFKFTLVGVSNTAVGLSAIYFCFAVIGLNDVAANLIGYLAGFLWSFFANKHWTFSSTVMIGKSMGPYALVCGAAYTVNLGAVFVTRNLLHHDSFLPHVVGAILYTGLAFIGSRYAFSNR